MENNWMNMFDRMDDISRDLALKQQDELAREPDRCSECNEPAEPDWHLSDGVFMCPECYDKIQNGNIERRRG